MDTGAKLPPRLSGKSGDSNGRQDRVGSVPSGSGGSNSIPSDLVHGELGGKGGKGKHSTPKSLRKAGSVKESTPTSSFLAKETMPVEA